MKREEGNKGGAVKGKGRKRENKKKIDRRKIKHT
jgi:hypothetical protein